MIQELAQLSPAERIADILALLNILFTALIAWFVFRYTKRAAKLEMLKSSVELVHDFDKAIVSSSENTAAMQALVPETPPGMTKQQEHLMCIYLNHLEISFRMWKMGYFDRKTLTVFVKDGIRYYGKNRAALEYQLGCGYDPKFKRFALQIFDETKVGLDVAKK